MKHDFTHEDEHGYRKEGELGYRTKYGKDKLVEACLASPEQKYPHDVYYEETKRYRQACSHQDYKASKKNDK
jgi:hypothetical protein